MKASEIQAGDVLKKDDGGIVYTVRTVYAREPVKRRGVESRVIEALVKYEQDGGMDVRTWYDYDEVPLEHP